MRQDLLEAKLVGVGAGAEMQSRKEFRRGQRFARLERQIDARQIREIKPLLAQQSRHEIDADQAVAEQGLLLLIAVDCESLIQGNVPSLVDQPAGGLVDAQGRWQPGRQIILRLAWGEQRTRLVVQGSAGEGAAEHAAFVHPLIAPVGVVLGHHQLLPGFIPAPQTVRLILRLAQEPLGGRRELGTRSLLAMLRQAARHGARLIGGKARDQARQDQQAGDEGGCDLLDRDGSWKHHCGACTRVRSRNSRVCPSRSNSCSPSMKWLTPRTITIGACTALSDAIQLRPSSSSASPMISCALTGDRFSAASVRAWSQRTYDSRACGVDK